MPIQNHEGFVFCSKILEETQRTEIYSKLNGERTTHTVHGPEAAGLQSVWEQFDLVKWS
jgi:hypothetical protein